MARTWVTTGSTNVEAVVNTVSVACDEGYVPDTIHLLGNPGITTEIDQAQTLLRDVVTAYGGDDPEFSVDSLEEETDYEALVSYYRDALAAGNERGETAIDITPGRKFMSALALQAGMEYDADHIFYLYLASPEYYEQLYPDIPQTALEFVDFREVGE